MTDDQLAHYLEHGWVAPVDVMSEAEAAGLLAALEQAEDDNILTRGQEVDGIDPASAVHLELRPGQMSLHHPWLVHGSQPNRSATRRVGLALQSYLAADVRPARGEHHVVPIRGAAPDRSFTTVPLPTALDTHARRVRAAANEALSSVLYDGADETRRL